MPGAQPARRLGSRPRILDREWRTTGRRLALDQIRQEIATICHARENAATCVLDYQPLPARRPILYWETKPFAHVDIRHPRSKLSERLMNFGWDGVGYHIGSAISSCDYEWIASFYGLKKHEVSSIRIYPGSPKCPRRSNIGFLTEGTHDNIPRSRSGRRFAQPWCAAGDVNVQKTKRREQTCQ